MRAYAGVLLYDLSGRVLLQRRDKGAPVNPGVVSVFGGRVERGETPERAAIREVLEELGVRLEPPLAFLGILRKNEGRHKALIVGHYFESVLCQIPNYCFEGELVIYQPDVALGSPKVGEYTKRVIRLSLDFGGLAGLKRD